VTLSIQKLTASGATVIGWREVNIFLKLIFFSQKAMESITRFP